MFPLHTPIFPSTAADLERLLNESLRRICSCPSDPVSINDDSYPHLSEIRVSLDHAQLNPNPPRPRSISNDPTPALQVDQFSLSARPLLVGPANIDLSLSAHNAQFVQGKDSENQVVIALESAVDGQVEVAIAQTDLAALVTALAQSQATKQGITVDAAQLKLQSTGPRSIEVQIRLRIRKLFVSASLIVAGQLSVDDALNFNVSGLHCTGEGPIANLACAILTPYLRQIESRPMPLAFLPLGNLRLRDINISVSDKLVVAAEFGSTGATQNHRV